MLVKKPETPTCGTCAKFFPFPKEVTPLDVAKRYNVKITDAGVALQVVVFTAIGGDHYCSFPKVRARDTTCQRIDEYIPRP